MDRLADEAGISKSQVSRIENENRGWSVESLEALAKALNVSVAQLLEDVDVWQDVPVFVRMLDDGTIVPAIGTKAVRAPSAHGELLAIQVESDSLYPRYHRGDRILVRKHSVDPATALGQECLVATASGLTMIRFVTAGSRPRRYNLTSHNQPAIQDADLAACRPVVR